MTTAGPEPSGGTVTPEGPGSSSGTEPSGGRTTLAGIVMTNGSESRSGTELSEHVTPSEGSGEDMGSDSGSENVKSTANSNGSAPSEPSPSVRPSSQGSSGSVNPPAGSNGANASEPSIPELSLQSEVFPVHLNQSAPSTMSSCHSDSSGLGSTTNVPSDSEEVKESTGSINSSVKGLLRSLIADLKNEGFSLVDPGQFMV
ncbi:hyphally-regulated protein-like [Electrophorus electricus]|uniref:hyphally-regulated protein-like n=1 Tax=Electrophorus electricus TaxID=8005 RepID=UPI0015D0531C|nr:hyphally-regulated protein-like [Electrophorus electricus]XP_035388278.1 hyphally-regulated protein-like [Electrophorus electricus]XP_035388279.1 hyphally-regulated protein-like [Electrophorus electricus]XP_035388280.1 hyphally-regulated protein-like [Electrophorus electricus]